MAQPNAAGGGQQLKAKAQLVLSDECRLRISRVATLIGATKNVTEKPFRRRSCPLRSPCDSYTLEYNPYRPARRRPLSVIVSASAKLHN
ncbi:unnamed protein product [Toxocara canis]|uniref:Uncharacterized protein n=1 Tax=Toxocara canis TaxID=6265 RepID=A0A183UQS9_TOXCA|nr:unnamed protein product [Toxocara canis]